MALARGKLAVTKYLASCAINKIDEPEVEVLKARELRGV
jgi:hypothetical protein